jgi:Protein of unknown function (DUF3024)
MALNDIERKRVERTVDAYIQKRRPAPHIRPELDIGFRIKGQSVEIFAIRPRWREPGVKMEHPVAKATYVRSRDLWKIFWLEPGEEHCRFLETDSLPGSPPRPSSNTESRHSCPGWLAACCNLEFLRISLVCSLVNQPLLLGYRSPFRVVR